jgi:hypothetical protein
MVDASAGTNRRAQELVASVEREVFAQLQDSEPIGTNVSLLLPPGLTPTDENIYLLATTFVEHGRIFRYTQSLRQDVAGFYAYQDWALTEHDHGVILRPHTRYIASLPPFDNRIIKPKERVLTNESFLTTPELLGLVHVPSKGVASSLVYTRTKREKPVPELLSHNGVAIGQNQYRRTTSTVYIPKSVRDQHIFVIGKTRMGKSTLMRTMGRQDIASDSGVTVIDPHGDLVEDLLSDIPESRIRDTIYFDAKDRDLPIGLNVFNAKTDEEAELIADDFVVAFRRLSTSWGERMDSILRHTVHALAKYRKATFFDIRKMLLNENFRQTVLGEIQLTPPAHEYWSHEFPNLPKDACAPILTRMSSFELSTALYRILGRSEGGLDVYDVMQGRRVLLVNLAGLGGENGDLLGSLIVSQFQLAAMRRACLPKEARIPHNLVIDEFHRFTTSAFEEIFSEAGKYELRLTAANQYLAQLEPRVKDAVLGNVGTLIMFKLGDSDARALRAELGDFEPEHAMDLARFECLCRPATGRRDTFHFKTLPNPHPATSYARDIREHTKQKFQYTIPTHQEPEKEAPRPESAQPECMAEAEPVRIKLPLTLSARERILHYVKLATYLTQRQIVDLCYPHMTPASAKSAASRDLKRLVKEKLLRVQSFGRENVYCQKRSCEPSAHNVGVRDLFVKVIRSKTKIVDLNFSLGLKTAGERAVIPDLYVAFQMPDGKLIKTLWEFDTGTEGVPEIVSKLTRYKAYPEYGPIICVVQNQQRRDLIKRNAPTVALWLGVMTDFETVTDPAFVRADRHAPESIFSSL